MTTLDKDFEAKIVAALDGHTKYSRDTNLTGDYLASKVLPIFAAYLDALSSIPEQGVGVEWPEPTIINPDIAQPTGIPYLDSLIHRVLDAQQDINFAANEQMSQPLADASALMDEVETAIRKFSAAPPRRSGRHRRDGTGLQSIRGPGLGIARIA